MYIPCLFYLTLNLQKAERVIEVWKGKRACKEIKKNDYNRINAQPKRSNMRIVIPDTYSQKRHRTSRNGHRYDPSAKDKEKIRKHLLPIKPPKPLESNLEVLITAFFKTPASWSDKKKSEVEGEYRAKTPDTDNIEKIMFDSMNDYIFKDDKQIVRCITEKRYSIKPSTVIQINEIPETD